MNLEIQFNANVIKRVKGHHFHADQIGSVLFILFCLYENQIELLDEFDDFNKAKRAILLYKELEVRGLVEPNHDAEKGQPLFSLTKEGIEFVEHIKSEFGKTSDTPITSEKIAVAGVEQLKEALSEDDPEAWIDEWIDIFPRGVKSGGRLLRSDRPSCLRKMRVFLREYNYDKNTILDATKAYIRSKEAEGFLYTRCAVYFIYRVEGSRVDKVSDLATWCDQVKHEQTEEKPAGSSDNLEIMV